MKIIVTENDFNVDEEVNQVLKGRRDIGAVVTFTGLVREMTKSENGPLPIISMTLEHYPSMTEKALTDIANSAMDRWPLDECMIIHRVGQLKPADRIVMVATFSSHRGAAFAAAEYIMDYLKTKAPFWKKEALKSNDKNPESNQEKWVDARDSDDDALKKWDC